MSFFGWLFYGRLCTRCKRERTSIWDPTIKDILCETCIVVEEINLRAYWERWSR